MQPATDAVSGLLETIRHDAAVAHKSKLHYEQLVLDYQTHLSQLSSIDQPSAKRPRTSSISSETHAKVQATLDTLNEKLAAVANDNQQLNQQLQTRLQDSANDGMELDKLRKDNAAFHDLQIRFKALQADQKADQLQTQRRDMEVDVKLTMGEESTRFLQAEVRRLSEQLAQSRFAADSAAAAHATSTTSASTLNHTLSDRLADANVRTQKLESHLGKADADFSSAKHEAERERQENEQQNEKLTNIANLQKDLTQKAEQRVSDYEEIIQTLKDEIAAKDNAANPTKAKLASHAEVLIKNLQQALEARLSLLHQQKEEMQRARASEMNMKARQEELIRESEDARWEAEQTRKELSRLKTQLKEQSRKMSQQEKQLQILGMGDAPASGDTFRGRPSIRPSEGSERLSIGRERVSLGPQTEIPVFQPNSDTPSKTQQVDAAMQELDELRWRHQKILHSMDKRRSAFS